MKFNENLKYLRKEECPEKILNESVSYSLMAGGKRLRPILVLDVYKMFKENYQEAMPYAVAIEMIHNFSLIHDDLPEVDNDDFRHGKPTNHKQFNHPTALLAGDSLFNQAYIVMSKDLAKSATQNKIRIFGEFSNAVDRMIAGEYLDTELEGQQISHQMLPDVTGKPVGNDKEHNKCTYVSVFGIEGAKKELEKITNEAVEILEYYGDKAEFLKQLAIYIKDRNK